ncbi:hypothetical protein Taro_023503 [Colocasia esculenta]|uniref:Uncharacterized protein n=1 Tax=Colocasia esculenta TaxID=4460 RepID=A0A843V4V2_COLES|nr:hypothetical protein [Colocasia esculenta]
MMSDGEKDSVPMLADADARTTFRRGRTRRFTGRSASMFSPATSFDEGGSLPANDAEGEGGATFRTGPLRRRPAAPQFVPMSGPLYGGRHRGTPTPPPPALPPEDLSNAPAAPPTGEVSQVRWADEGGGYGARRNQHLLDSGQLGMCNDPYCTTCPAAYHSSAVPPPGRHGGSASQSTDVIREHPGRSAALEVGRPQ